LQRGGATAVASAEAEVAMALAEVLDTNVESESELVGRRETKAAGVPETREAGSARSLQPVPVMS